jgi:acyl carrier protein
MSDIKELILEKIKEVAFKKVSDTVDLFETGVLSSILVVDLAVALEDSLNISIPFTEITLENFATVEKIKNYLDTKIN